jgi:cbb3-type cytochrome oxidase subunit 3
MFQVMIFEMGVGILVFFMPFIFFLLIIGVIIYLFAKKAKSVSKALEP